MGESAAETQRCKHGYPVREDDPTVCIDNEASAAHRLRLLREIVALCRDLGITLTQALDKFEAHRG